MKGSDCAADLCYWPILRVQCSSGWPSLALREQAFLLIEAYTRINRARTLSSETFEDTQEMSV